jgi:hypothetical protein
MSALQRANETFGMGTYDLLWLLPHGLPVEGMGFYGRSKEYAKGLHVRTDEMKKDQ